MKEYKLIQWYPSLPTEWIDNSFPIIVVNRNGDQYHLHPSLKGLTRFAVVSEREVERNEEFWKEVVPVFEITSFHTGDNKILSVKRGRDGEVFTVGEPARTVGKKNSHVVSAIEIKQKQLDRDTYDGIDRIWLCWEENAGGNWMEDSERIKEPLFTTVDGIEIFHSYDEYYLVTADFKIDYCSSFSEGDLSFNCFSAKKEAENWILKHKPCLSIIDVMDADYNKDPIDTLIELVKTRL